MTTKLTDDEKDRLARAFGLSPDNFPKGRAPKLTDQDYQRMIDTFLGSSLIFQLRLQRAWESIKVALIGGGR